MAQCQRTELREADVEVRIMADPTPSMSKNSAKELKKSYGSSETDEIDSVSLEEDREQLTTAHIQDKEIDEILELTEKLAHDSAAIPVLDGFRKVNAEIKSKSCKDAWSSSEDSNREQSSSTNKTKKNRQKSSKTVQRICKLRRESKNRDLTLPKSMQKFATYTNLSPIPSAGHPALLQEKEDDLSSSGSSEDRSSQYSSSTPTESSFPEDSLIEIAGKDCNTQERKVFRRRIRHKYPSKRSSSGARAFANKRIPLIDEEINENSSCDLYDDESTVEEVVEKEAHDNDDIKSKKK